MSSVIAAHDIAMFSRRSSSVAGVAPVPSVEKTLYSKTYLKQNVIVPVFFSRFHRFPFYKGLCFNKTKYKKYDRLGLQ